MSKYINYSLLAIIILLIASIVYPSKNKVDKNIIENEEKTDYEYESVTTSSITKTIKKESTNINIVDENETNIDLELETDVSEKKSEIKNEKKALENILISSLSDVYEVNLKTENIVLSKSKDSKNKYTLSLNSTQKIASVLSSGNLIVLKGIIEKEGEESTFTLSFNENYKDYTDFTYLELVDKDLKKVLSCETSFLSGLTSEYEYTIKLDLYGDILSCYIQQWNQTDKKYSVFDNQNKQKLIKEENKKMLILN